MGKGKKVWGRVKKSGEDTKDIGNEIGDIMFALVCLANSHNIDLDKSWKMLGISVMEEIKIDLKEKIRLLFHQQHHKLLHNLYKNQIQ